MKTTRELAKEDTHNKLVQNLQELLVKNYDAHKGFIKAFKEARSKDLKDHLKIRAFLHQRNATEIDKLIHTLNETPLEEGSAVGRFHRIWMDVMIAITGHDDKTILEECLRGQKATLNEYKDKLKNYKFPGNIKEILKKHLLELELSLQEVKSIQDI
ncbi:PA2169 family four-helix-bundle protein [Antarcticibacterium arcticum]|uniref:PA2169 family four-helix-bundle protein n=1 Tax=Antarcticibacterium arcticum TaxID=2585771 RepID=A0A5B8YH71_9FLAO|nr:PA2169 family four-helix-bundle protein [Antarcticibacterium arcticum]QED36921.1 PA2169 family four-helix-bundle protein [Antarcticibacterium arcticum]